MNRPFVNFSNPILWSSFEEGMWMIAIWIMEKLHSCAIDYCWCSFSSLNILYSHEVTILISFLSFVFFLIQPILLADWKCWKWKCFELNVFMCWKYQNQHTLKNNTKEATNWDWHSSLIVVYFLIFFSPSNNLDKNYGAKYLPFFRS